MTWYEFEVFTVFELIENIDQSSNNEKLQQNDNKILRDGNKWRITNI